MDYILIQPVWVSGAGHGGQPEAGGVHPAQPAVGARARAAGRRRRAAAITRARARTAGPARRPTARLRPDANMYIKQSFYTASKSLTFAIYILMVFVFKAANSNSEVSSEL